MKYITKNCLNCTNEFNASLKEHKRGNAKFCCQSCASRFNGKLMKPEPNISCSFCNKPFYRNTSKQKNSKSGFQFCSRICKDTAQQLENAELFGSIMPDHFGTATITSSSTYRAIAFRAKPMVCERCDYSKIPEIIQIHHKDRNRLNNSLENLEALCPNCHQADHFLNKDGPYAPIKRRKVGGESGNRIPDSDLQGRCFPN